MRGARALAQRLPTTPNALTGPTPGLTGSRSLRQRSREQPGRHLGPSSGQWGATAGGALAFAAPGPAPSPSLSLSPLTGALTCAPTGRCSPSGRRDRREGRGRVTPHQLFGAGESEAPTGARKDQRSWSVGGCSSHGQSHASRPPAILAPCPQREVGCLMGLWVGGRCCSHTVSSSCLDCLSPGRRRRRWSRSQRPEQLFIPGREEAEGAAAPSAAACPFVRQKGLKFLSVLRGSISERLRCRER